MSIKMVSIGRAAAISLADSKWWEGKTAREIANLQLFVNELCCPFGVFHRAVEEALGRPVYTHEFGLDYEGICMEFLGKREAPTFEEILGKIPADKIAVVVISPNEAR